MAKPHLEFEVTGKSICEFEVNIDMCVLCLLMVDMASLDP